MREYATCKPGAVTCTCTEASSNKYLRGLQREARKAWHATPTLLACTVWSFRRRSLPSGARGTYILYIRCRNAVVRQRVVRQSRQPDGNVLGGRRRRPQFAKTQHHQSPRPSKRRSSGTHGHFEAKRSSPCLVVPVRGRHGSPGDGGRCPHAQRAESQRHVH